ncbi:MAG: cobalamin-binding protein [Thermoanaerobaculia bacterium]|jgi:iron complex transport system substrate-binding protein|nr:cobalamin-binding protein [Thermoanaerobaculia bacterium]MBP9826207.1 cobalamin-binding protein [Thermoanaerobaculia bacterium]
MRIVSLVPNATEILFALGAGDDVVGVSHECDFPPEARTRPILTGSALTPGMTPHEVDAAVSAQLASGASLYTLDEERLAALDPDLLFTQELCPVCAVSTAQVGGAVAPMARCPEVLSLDPTRLEDVLADILHVGERLGRSAAAECLVDDLRARLERVERATHGRPRPTVVALEWLDPPFLGGHWVPQMIAIAGGRDPFAVAPGERSRRATWDEIAAADPDWIVAMPCGFDAAGAAGEVAKLAGDPLWSQLRAVRSGRVAAVDANGCFSRPGPRLVDGIEHLHRLLSGDAPTSA